jgi:outer membrane immunogenic protein
MKKIFLGAVSVIALGMSVPASAADLAARPYTKAPPMVAAAVYDWSGFYIGGNGGGGWSHNCWDLTGTAATGPLATPLAEGCNNASGATAGGQIGYRWQTASWVFGLEGQGNWADFRGSNVNLLAGTPLVAAGLTDQTRIDAFGLLTGQVGWAWNNVLGYVKGGAAVVGNKHRTFTAAGALSDSVDETRWGAAVGAGFEVGFASNWSVGLEYDHLFLGNHTVNAVTPGGAFSASDRIRQDVDIGLVRLNYRWGGSTIARY